MKLNDNLKRLREKRSLTQDTVAKALNVSRQAVSNWEQGKRYPDANMLLQIAKYYGVRVDDLLKSETEDNHVLMINKERFEEVLFIGSQIIMMLAVFFLDDFTGLIFIYMGCIFVAAFTKEVCESIEYGINFLKNKK
ncbi:XRE family transcriptional regulator [Erysipelothrix sp. strain 2 (EsS2-7-Brazil)]|uniref:helix-turn-helix domain-containing protein n=1 Tax=Erysipelothrix sp. strain 2 (EsS2-7-Brazil) TaxID=2500579 RepID=UPI00190C6353|nr:helix-turn-helix transcriptional regulator [Erysipelothrix sp. strain 2 (EsS2-7-Brazil)]MBK2403520.1 XRE family transcriptional regulator [Erysipelothrix sp. strain 2 (EsS2-7-Brazil)]